MLKINYNISDITKIIKGELISKSDTNENISDILIDSRKLISSENCLFFALVSKTNNGHKYVETIYNKGVKSFIVSKVPQNIKVFENVNIIKVNNTLAALQDLSAFHRKKFNIPVIGITGSNGKTIVKEWLFQLLRKDKKIIRSPKSYNSQIGVPLSVLQMKDEHELAFFEAGISETDEMDKLETIIRPQIGIFTNIGPAHGENFFHEAQKINEKLKLFTKSESLIFCSDYLEIKERIIESQLFKKINIFSWGKNSNSDLQIKNINKNNKQTTIAAIYKNVSIQIKIPFIDDASIENAIHCWAFMLFFGYQQNIISERMESLSPVAMRLELKEGINNCSIINDSYNSDINSLNIALDFMLQQKQHRKKTIILSDILQSGKNDADLYTEVADLLFEKGIKRIIGVGSAIKRYANKFNIEKEFYETSEQFLKYFSTSSLQNETVLLKGARKFEFENINKVLQQKAHETVLEINLNAISHNLNYYRSLLKSATKIMAMVKAFSYGSGSFEIANVLQFQNVDYLAVAYADEGVELRKAGITLPIMVMNPDRQSFDSIIKYNLEPEVYCFKVLDLLEEAIERNIIQESKPIGIHIKLDTGMHRLGFESQDLEVLIKKIKKSKHFYIKSIFSHLAASDDKAHDNFTRHQIKLFSEMSSYIKSEFNYNILLHILNSAGISRFNESQFDMVRLGIALYGVASDVSQQNALQNVNTLKSTISQIKTIKANDSIGYNRNWTAEKEMRIATIPIGYADGLNRRLSNGKGKLLINNNFAPIVGNICMDMCMADITNIDVEEGDDVIVFGNDYPIKKLADVLETIPYEILTAVSRRVKRVYFHE